jgi:hypothetical protein
MKTAPSRDRTKLSVRTQDLDGSIPKLEELANRLFRLRWIPLDARLVNWRDGEYPGVYVMAYAPKKLRGKRVRERDVFYVGMTHAGSAKRLRQFMRGLEVGHGHRRKQILQRQEIRSRCSILETEEQKTILCGRYLHPLRGGKTR